MPRRRGPSSATCWAGRTIALDVPGAGQMLLYEPRHPTAFDL
jgi:hypothetical protein